MVPCSPAWHTQPARLSVRPQTAASRAQAAGQEAPEDACQAAGEPLGSERQVMLEMTLISGSQSQLHTRIAQRAS